MMKRRAVLLTACLLLTLPAFQATSTRAAPSEEEIAAAEERLLELERDFQLVSERYNLVAERLESLQERIATTELEVEALERKIGRRQDAAVTLAQALYKGGTEVGVEALLSSDSFTEMERQLTYLEASEEGQLRVFERLGADKEELDFKIAELERSKDRALSERDRLAELRSNIDSKVEDQRAEVERLNEVLERARRRQARLERQQSRAAQAVSFPTVSVPDTPPAPNPNAQRAVDAALSQLGKPYQWGAAGPNSYDCSGLTMWAWAQAGVSLPHNSGAQHAATPRVARSDIQPGDLLFFGSPIHHVGMYIGNGQMVEAPYSGQVVRVNSAFRSDLVGIGRPG